MAINVRYQYEKRRGTEKFADAKEAERFIRWVASIGGQTVPSWFQIGSNGVA
jgi:hypothetical protein